MMVHAKELILAAAMLGATSAAMAAPEQDFQARTTGQLLEVCRTKPDDPAHANAMRFCHGFVLGVLARAPRGCTLPREWRRVFAGYAAWAHANPIHLDDNPGNSLVEFLDLHGHCRT
ncbi:hypothetical protein [Falsiroseomonas sp. E2-1-a20]|uniref:hypothetical protein n=1 Tax=Falsiroseomonas sp. E2-1-a20 TaxID=3239300 RepID=UPI003F3AE056